MHIFLVLSVQSATSIQTLAMILVVGLMLGLWVLFVYILSKGTSKNQMFYKCVRAQ